MNATSLIRALRAALQSYGVTALRLRANYEMRRRFGWYRPMPRAIMSSGASHTTYSNWPFAVDLDRVAASTDRDAALARADRVADGWHHAYRSEWRRLPQSPAEWSVHPLLGTRYPSAPWWELRPYLALDPALGDVKDTWEPARFTWVFDLVRGFAITRDERFAEAFWSRVESFIEGNPAFRTIQWTCGQETSIRALSCLWAERGFDSARASTPARRAALETLLASSGERVADAIEYAISQRNNHGISEATGLIALGARLGTRHPDAALWLERGAAWIDWLVLDQFAEDGWYVQHSLTYVRMALEQLVVAQRVLTSLRQQGLSDVAGQRVRAAIALLLELHDEETGDVPNHGANDGSWVMPLATTGYRDFRPSITAAAATFGAHVPEHFQISNEALAWLDASVQRRADEPLSRVVAGSSGWVSARTERARVFVRAGEYRSNPSHIDPAHVDVWTDREPRAIDAGTYRYCAPSPWQNALSAIGVHNTLDIPGLPAAKKDLRFLWVKRPRAHVVSAARTPTGIEVVVENETWLDDYGVSHRRRCLLGADTIDVIDEVDVGDRPAVEVSVHWLVPRESACPKISSATPGRLVTVAASPDSIDGWWSPCYAERSAAVSLTFVMTVTGRATVRSTFVARNS